MNYFNSCKLLGWATLFAVSTAHATQIGDIDDRTKAPGCYQSVSGGWGLYTVKGGKSNSTDVHDPRCERRNINPKIDVGRTLTFEGRFIVDNADNTTIAQILNYDQNSSDKHKPVVFILARVRGSEYGIYDQGNELDRVDPGEAFTLKITSYSVSGKMYSDIYINGSKKSTKLHARVGTHSQMRYGNYHHGGGTAKIRVKNVSFVEGTGSSSSSSSSSGSSSTSSSGGSPPSGHVRLRNRNSNRCVDVAGVSNNNGANVQQWGCGGGNNQKWKFRSMGGGYYQIRARHSDKCLDAGGSGNGANMQQWGCWDGGHNQQFRLEDRGGGWFRLKGRQSGRCVSVAGESKSNGGNLELRSCGTRWYQQFKFD